MTDDQIIHKMAKAMCLSMETDSNPPCEGVCYICKKQARAAFAVAKPLIRAHALEESATVAENHIKLADGFLPDASDDLERRHHHSYANAALNIGFAIRALKENTR